LPAVSSPAFPKANCICRCDHQSRCLPPSCPQSKHEKYDKPEHKEYKPEHKEYKPDGYKPDGYKPDGYKVTAVFVPAPSKMSVRILDL
jgi:hypothetical protein